MKIINLLVYLSTGLRVAQVRLIFRLPEEHGIYSQPLAYVHWFKSLTATPVTDLGMFRVSLSSHNRRQRASIIPITQILRTCHLIPGYGGGVDHTWTSESVLDQASFFYLNPYLRHHDFFMLRHLYDLFESRRTQHALAMRRRAGLLRTR